MPSDDALDAGTALGDKAGMRVLILGGTTEATALAALMAGEPAYETLVSLAGRTASPSVLPVPMRVGGFGGAEGLARFLAGERIVAVVDATHPFAARISRHAAEACAGTGVPLLALRRPPWRPLPGDRWSEVADVEGAVPALGPEPRRVFLTIGRQALAPFAAAPQHRYLVRTIEPVGDALRVPHLDLVAARGPFAEADERALMVREGVEVLVSKNAGGTATAAKLAAARALGLSVIMVRRPAKPLVETVEDPAAALAWCRAHAGASTRRAV